MTQTISLVSFACEDQRHVGLCAAEHLGYLSLRHRSFQFSDFGCFLARQDLLEASNAADSDCVELVTTVVDPFEIGGDRIRFDAIDMIDERKFVRIGNECQGDEPVNIDRLAVAVAPQDYLWVSNFVNPRSENLAIAYSRAPGFAFANSSEASDSSEVADFVKTDEVSNVFPIFNNRHMGSFAGKAHSIAVSSTTQGG